MKIFVIGGDGFCGWPTSLELSNSNHEVHIIDNLSRRKIDYDLNTNSLTPISSINKRIQTWFNLTKKHIIFHNVNIQEDFFDLRDLFVKNKPDVVVHFGEQRAAPYSMIGYKEAYYTAKNNILGTMNILECIKECNPNCHLVHLGTMGVYGYGVINTTIPDGYLQVEIDTKNGKEKKDIIFPPNPGSIYHLTKTVDHQFFQFYKKNYQLKITDLHQGIVWGTNTDLTLLHEDLVNRFDYDGHYGTVLNRFLVQGYINHPLTVYGSGGQTRAFIHISDTARCIKLAIDHDTKKTDPVRIFNQISECYSVNQLAELVSKITGTNVQYIDNPRKELAENNLEVSNEGLSSLGFKPILLDESLFKEIEESISKYSDRIDINTIMPTARW